MQGYVFSYRPQTGEGTVVTESGMALPFASRPAEAAWQAGDWVAFDLEGDAGVAPRVLASNLRLLQRGADRLSGMQRPLLKRLYDDLIAPHVAD